MKRTLQIETSNKDVHLEDTELKIAKGRTLDSFSRASRDNVVIA